MAQRVHVICHIAVAAILSGVGGIAHLLTGRLRHHSLIAVFPHGDGFRIAFAAVAGEGYDALLRAGGLLGYGLGITVSQGFGIAVHITDTAGLAGVGGIAHLIMGGSRHHILIGVPQGLYDAIHVALTADSAGVSGVAGGGTGGSRLDLLLLVALGFRELIPVIVFAA